MLVMGRVSIKKIFLLAVGVLQARDAQSKMFFQQGDLLSVVEVGHLLSVDVAKDNAQLVKEFRELGAEAISSLPANATINSDLTYFDGYREGLFVANDGYSNATQRSQKLFNAQVAILNRYYNAKCKLDSQHVSARVLQFFGLLVGYLAAEKCFESSYSWRYGKGDAEKVLVILLFAALIAASEYYTYYKPELVSATPVVNICGMFGLAIVAGAAVNPLLNLPRYLWNRCCRVDSRRLNHHLFGGGDDPLSDSSHVQLGDSRPTRPFY